VGSGKALEVLLENAYWYKVTPSIISIALLIHMHTKATWAALFFSLMFSGCASFAPSPPENMIIGIVEWTKQYPRERSLKSTATAGGVEKIVVSNHCGYEQTKLTVVDALYQVQQKTLTVSSTLDEWCKPKFQVTGFEYLVIIRAAKGKNELVRLMPIFATKGGAHFILPEDMFGGLAQVTNKIQKPLACGEIYFDAKTESETAKLAREGAIQKCGEEWSYAKAVYWQDLKTYLLQNRLDPASYIFG
jgi:hypothetical protein